MHDSTSSPYSPSLPARQHQHFALKRLRLRWGLTALAYGIALFLCFLILRRAWAEELVARYLFLSGLVLTAELVVLWRILPQNHPEDRKRLLAGLGYGTALTLVCGLLIGLLAGFLAVPQPYGWLAWAPAILYTTARLVDWMDGTIARITNHTTKLGAILDIELDGLGLLIAVVLGIQYGRLPLWYLPLAVSRQLFVAGIWLRRKGGKPVRDLPPSDNRRLIAGYQTAFLCLALWPVLDPLGIQLAAYLFAIPLIVSFGRDWLVVSTAIDPETDAYRRVRRNVKTFFEGWLPLIARIGGVIAASLVLRQAAPILEQSRSLLTTFELSAPQTWSALLLVAAILALPFFGLGVLARLAALPLVGLALFDIPSAGLQLSATIWLLAASIIVAHLGAGIASLWTPEEKLLRRRYGGPHTASP